MELAEIHVKLTWKDKGTGVDNSSDRIHLSGNERCWYQYCSKVIVNDDQIMPEMQCNLSHASIPPNNKNHITHVQRHGLQECTSRT